MINHPLPRHALSVLACTVLAACGGGTPDDSDTAATATAAEPESRAAIASTTSPGAVRLASANASGTPGNLGGRVCAISADGQKVLMITPSSNLVSGDSNSSDDLFLKDLGTGAVTQVNTSPAGAPLVNRTQLLCHDMTPDATWVAFTSSTGGGNSFLDPGTPLESTLMLKNIRSGELLRVSPTRGSLPNTQGFTFGSMTPDGSRVAFIAQPTVTYLGAYNWVVNGPARLMVYDRPTGQVLDLSGTALLDAVVGPSTNRALISPDGREVAFDSRRNHPAAGDNNGQHDVLLADVATGAVRLAGLVSQGNPVLHRYTADGLRLVVEYPNDGPLGVGGLYAATLATGGSTLLMPVPSSESNRPRAYRVDDTASRVAFLRFDPATAQRQYAFVRDTATGSEQRADRSATNVNGNGNTTSFAISGDGQHVALGSSSTNLLRLPRNTFVWQVYVKTLSAAPAAQ